MSAHLLYVSKLVLAQNSISVQIKRTFISFKNYLYAKLAIFKNFWEVIKNVFVQNMHNQIEANNNWLDKGGTK